MRVNKESLNKVINKIVDYELGIAFLPLSPIVIFNTETGEFKLQSSMYDLNDTQIVIIDNAEDRERCLGTIGEQTINFVNCFNSDQEILNYFNIEDKIQKEPKK